MAKMKNENKCDEHTQNIMSGENQPAYRADNQEEIRSLIDIAWKQYEILFVKIPEQYHNKVKQYQWIIVVVLGFIVQICIKFSSEYVNYQDKCSKATILAFLIFAIIGCFTAICYAIRYMNIEAKIPIPLAEPWKILRDPNLQSHSLQELIVSEIQAGTKGARKRIAELNKELNLLGKATIFAIGSTFVFCMFGLLTLMPPKEKVMSQNKPSQSTPQPAPQPKPTAQSVPPLPSQGPTLSIKGDVEKPRSPATPVPQQIRDSKK
jgi:hypothetical protein